MHGRVVPTCGQHAHRPPRSPPSPRPSVQRAATFCAEKMHGFLTRSKAFQAKDAMQGLAQAFHDCEAEFIQIAGREGLRDGTTAIVALLHDDALTVAHVGDSRGVLCRAGGTALAITQDHKPELEAEKRRIEALGGFVSYIGCWRTCQCPPLAP
jgi:serine/threonine protein phosphatase PrpC